MFDRILFDVTHTQSILSWFNYMKMQFLSWDGKVLVTNTCRFDVNPREITDIPCSDQ